MVDCLKQGINIIQARVSKIVMQNGAALSD